MADAILGHDHLDHGRHLKHHHHPPQPGARFSRGTRPTHIGLGSQHAHLHKHSASHAQGSAHAHLHQHADHDHGHAHHHHRNTITLKRFLWVGLGACIIIPILLLFYQSFSGLAVVLTVIGLNTLIEYHKYFMDGVPVDLEILFVGSAYATVAHGVGWGLLIAALGPLVASAARGHVCDATLRKSLAVFVCVLAASVLAATRLEIAFAVLLGVAAHYGIIIMSGVSSGFNTTIARLTALGFNSYIALFVLPLITSIA